MAGVAVVAVGPPENAGLDAIGQAAFQHRPVAEAQPQMDVAGQQIPQFVDGDMVARVGAVPDPLAQPAVQGFGRQGVHQQFIGDEPL